MDTDPESWEITNSSIVYEGIQFDIRHDKITSVNWESEVDYIEDLQGVAVLPFTTDGKIVAVKEWRHPIKDYTLSIPGGEIEDDDCSPVEAAKRELREETGYVSDNYNKLISINPASGLMNGLDHYFVAFNCENKYNKNTEEYESIEVKTYMKSKLENILKEGNIADPKIPIALFYYNIQQYE